LRRQLYFTLIASFALTFSAQSTPLLRVPVEDNSSYEKILLGGFDIVGYYNDYIEIVGWHEDLSKLESSGIAYTIIHEDLEEFYRSRFDYELDDMGGYATFSEIGEWALEFVNDYPDIVSGPDTIGYSLEDRPLWVIKISDNPEDDEDEPELFLNSAIHAREVITPLTLMHFAELLAEGYGDDERITDIVDNREIWLLPVVNPDGYTYNEETNPNGGGMWRKNKRTIDNTLYGVDLNRNFSYQWGYDNRGSSPTPSAATYRGTEAHSEPETQVVEEFFNSRNFTAAINYHSYSNLILYPYGYDDDAYPEYFGTFEAIAEELNETLEWETGRAPDVLYTVNGEATDWMVGGADNPDNRFFGFVFEVGSRNDGFWPATNRIDDLIEAQEEPLLTLCELIDDPFQFSRPGEFSLLTPINEDTTWSFDEMFRWEAPIEPDPDYTTHYNLWLGESADLSDAELVADSIEADSIGLLNIDFELLDNERYYWTVQALDDDTPGMWASDTFSFYIYNLETPSAFNLVLPQDSAIISLDTVTINWTRSSDPDPGDNIEYLVQYSLSRVFSEDSTYSVVIEDTFHVLSDIENEMINGVNNSGQLDELPDNETIYWRVKASDRYGMFVWGDGNITGRSFSIDVFDTPYPFTLISPGNGDTCYTLDTRLVWNMSRDRDLVDYPHYDVWLDTLPDLSSAWMVVDSLRATSYDVPDLLPGRTWYWTARATDSNTPGTWAEDTLSFVTSDLQLPIDAKDLIPEQYSVIAVYPNPFNSSLNIIVGLPETSNLQIGIFNIMGREINSIAPNDYSQGYHTLSISNENASSGIYFVKISVPGKLNEMKKVVLVK